LSQNANNLASVSAASASSAWAVGSYYTDADPNVFRNLSLHWDGSRWTAIAPPNVGMQENTLFGVSALPGGSAWAAGYYADSSFHVRTLTEHWDGSSWSVTPTENPGAARDVLFSISAVSDHDVWAVGYRESSLDGRFHTLIEHWDGQRWHTVPSPNPGTNGNELYAVAADGPSDAWAVGQQLSSSFPSRALIEHWDGRAWRVAPAPVLPDRSLDPWAAAATGGHLIAGGVKESDISPQTTLAFTAFRTTTLTPSANVGAGENDFYGMTVSPAGAWAAGRTIGPLTLNQSPLAEKLRDGQWSVVPTPNPAGTGGNAGFGGISSAPGGGTWAVGAYSTATSKNRTLVERYVP
jgi:hypothetical protein